MVVSEGKYWIDKLRGKFIILYLTKVLLLAASFGMLLMWLADVVVWSAWLLFILGLLLGFIVGLLIKPKWKLSNLDIAKHLDAKFPELEESATLLLKNEQELSLLEKFQVEKILKIFPLTGVLGKHIRNTAIGFIFLVFSCLLNYCLPIHKVTNKFVSTSEQNTAIKEIILPEIERFSVRIVPPRYTGIAERVQDQFTLKVEAGSRVFWDIKTDTATERIRIIFNEKEIVDLSKSGKFNKEISHPGFYQLELDGKKSDLYPIEIIPDLPVRIKINKPKPQTTIDIGDLPRINLEVSLNDDYGISDAFISATLSTGKGEGVSFTEKKLTFNGDFRARKTAMLTKTIDLPSIGMKPGDELYFFVSAKDNHGQDSRSDVYMVTMVDTAELLSMAGMTNGVDLVPEYFRSQRQIIIDTEKLLKEESTLSTLEFKNKANALGMDQKLLRLRYGKFLGEEFESGDEHHEHEEGDGHAHEEIAYGDVQALMDQYAHKHDIAEDATFFEPAIKAQLKAVLNEMWTAELRLRTFKLREALPFEYKALRLLKDLQQKSRAYVAKTTVKTTKLKPEKRLTGELDKIIQPTLQTDFKKDDNTIQELRVLLAVLESRKAGKPFGYGEKELLRAGERQLIIAAANKPATYLPALKSLRLISTGRQRVTDDITRVQRALSGLIVGQLPEPKVKSSLSEPSLYRNYFNHLKNDR
ncbi:MAG: hypothetical protein EOO90_13870 [Pedobacter sp.]|nr:MAG: hypothetical protein EOO90_13870 [Pedobacter sp.]